MGQNIPYNMPFLVWQETAALNDGRVLEKWVPGSQVPCNSISRSKLVLLPGFPRSLRKMQESPILICHHPHGLQSLFHVVTTPLVIMA